MLLFHFHHNRFGIRIRYTSLGNILKWLSPLLMDNHKMDMV
ncbi:hypothetical protein ECMP0209401_1778 [Escherichia coli MP020940.1]|uniref:Uncharacterized protein n=1 Tax=Escherichia coli MS 85-1 TaxID=679202 RepID=A0AAN3SE55_ECOLX|nr:hypothetical protein EDL933_2325 [Escherichia coli O157:H7 str. EDL933]AVJ77475.1 hypothetical protein CSC06_4605 [Escherichia coli]EEC25939.1 hypothetical protein ESCCO14588_3478 [Escherichia coli O157:H7 str. TW14588]EFI90828.1 hypothetical protein HMPREF9551_00139 [Escherichia coli MS 196-1]EFJ79433.1 hypothetical protein HMPREF9534_04525 [Escherichia coli MS 69-1]EFJ86688.1 hypothetical protein HMPREF9536_03066 [Escherichia coli MS 84-1]EFK45968.1 hypothetical protein HMPREF9346_02328 